MNNRNAVEAFRACDADGDGKISREDFAATMHLLGLPETERSAIFDLADPDGKGFIEYTEFGERVIPCLLSPSVQAMLAGSWSPTRSRAASTFTTTSKSRAVALAAETIGAATAEGLGASVMDLGGLQPGCVGLLIMGATNVPKLSLFGPSASVRVTVEDKAGRCLAREQSFIIAKDTNPVWNQVFSIGRQSKGSPTAALPSRWDVNDTFLRFTLVDGAPLMGQAITLFGSRRIGECTISLRELLGQTMAKLMLWNAAGEAVLSSHCPCMPCALYVMLLRQTIPESWKCTPGPPAPISPPATRSVQHVFMMTRGTRGDVQPFVALARGMAEQLGWIVTICTEVRWQHFVLSRKVSRGSVNFLPSGGDTEARMTSRLAKWAVAAKSSAMQMAILASSEVEFFSSATVFVDHVLQLSRSSTPVSLIVFGLTVARVAALISELCDIPLVGFILQPSCIPSRDEEWTAVQHIPHTESQWLSQLERALFTSHASLLWMKRKFEMNRFAKYNLPHLRDSLGLPILDTWQAMRQMNVPLVIPMHKEAFPRPSDWWEGICLTEFIFLRDGAASSVARPASLGEPLDSFIASATAAGAKLGLVTFSSMPVSWRKVLLCLVRMVQDCCCNFRLVYVGKSTGRAPAKLLRMEERLLQEGRLLKVPSADFGLLFPVMDCFVVHGGLGTTVEALRMRKPCCVTGPLLLDQRFWGMVCWQKGVGPKPVHIDGFAATCVDFVDGALDADDPHGWQAHALSQDWGTGDGVACNVECFKELVDRGLQPMRFGAKAGYTVLPAHLEMTMSPTQLETTMSPRSLEFMNSANPSFSADLGLHSPEIS
mmetsp:Transcript_2218/g.5187  ORF Transcript_2218/g.5187 Transcript_2218/m.5187 type:complete len:827 (+) Transcript_2218:231-2711(+)